MANIVSREIRLKSHPIGMPDESDFELVEVTIPEPKTGEVLVRNIYMSVDPYMRGGMRNAKLSKTLEGGCVGQIVKSNSIGHAGLARILCLSHEGMIKWEETIIEGLENTPQAFIGLFKGENMGKMTVKIGP